MGKFWIAALKATGPVAVVAFLLSLTLQQLFRTEIIHLFDSEQRFIIIMIVLTGVFICLFGAIVVHKDKQSSSPQNDKDMASKSVTITDTKINGDFVMGDKNEVKKEDE